jgi:putative molybdopterin biosynthesis protein
MNKKRSIYLSLIPLEEVKRIVLTSLSSLRLPVEEQVPSWDALGRTTVREVFCQRSCPHYAAAAMDGIAVDAKQTYGASDASPKFLLDGKTAFRINTGMPMPRGTNAVIMVEKIHENGEGTFEIRQAAHPWQHVRPVGEDTIKGDMLLPANQVLTPADIAALLNAGVLKVFVRPRPRIGILPTGSELVPPEKTPKPGEVIESNSRMMAAYLSQDNLDATIFPPCRDEKVLLEKAVSEALAACDVLFILSGSSAGAKDFSRHTLETLGEVLVHGIAMMPGKPALFALVSGKAVFGIPGYPTSAALYYEEVIRPFFRHLAGKNSVPVESVEAELARKVPSKLGLEEFIRVRLGKVGSRWVAVPLARGAGVLKSLREADGIMRVPFTSEGVADNQFAPVVLRRRVPELEKQLLMIGSHDLSLDWIDSMLRARSEGICLAIGAVGSLGGLFALRGGKAHFTGIHLLDPETRTYNLPYIKKHLPGAKMRVIHLVERTQGLLVAYGNPKDIRGIADLTRAGIQFVNRQRGAGTRVLFDYLLSEEGILPEAVSGYANEVATHSMVAAEIQGGMADCGMGIEAAARAMDLDFIPLATEPYDLVIPDAFMEDTRFQIFLEVIVSGTFRKTLQSLGGYNTAQSGKEKQL